MLLGVAHEPRRALAHLRDAARGGLQRVGEHGLDRVDDHDPGRLAREYAEERLHVRLREQLHPIRRDLEALGPQRDLPYRLLSGHVQGTGGGIGETGQYLEQQGRLADPGLAADEDHGSRHEPAAEHPVELRQIRLDP